MNETNERKSAALSSRPDDPIALFDSGLGGLSVLAQLKSQLPHENVMYLGDSIHNPYGTKSKEQIIAYCIEICDEFVKNRAKAIVIACNTATSAAVPLLRSRYSIPVIGMEPALKPATRQGEHQKIAVWATELTLREEKFHSLSERFGKDHEIRRVPCMKLVELVENDQLDDQEQVQSVLWEYLEQSGYPDVDSIVLGCTHFIFFRQKLQEIVGDSVKIIDGNEGTVSHLQEVLDNRKLLNPSGETGRVEIRNSQPELVPFSYTLLDRLEHELKCRKMPG